MVGVTGLEPTTPCSLSKYSSHLSYTPMCYGFCYGYIVGRSGETRTRGLLLPKQALYHLSHTPLFSELSFRQLINIITSFDLMQVALLIL